MKTTGKKLQMSQIFSEDGTTIPVTLIELENVSGFEVGDEIAVSGKSKGKGFAGVMKRWGFHGQQRTRGQSDRERAPGSIGGGTTPGRVWPGKKMAGRMGGKRVTVKGLEVVGVDEKAKTIKVTGSIPGPRGVELEIRRRTTDHRRQKVDD